MLFWGAEAALPGVAEVKIFNTCPLPRGNSEAVISVNTRLPTHLPCSPAHFSLSTRRLIGEVLQSRRMPLLY